MALTSRRVVATFFGILAASWLLAACTHSGSGPESGTTGTSGESSVAIGIETSQLFVTVENKAGAPLLGLQIAVQSVGGSLKFIASIPRMESGEKRDISISDFRSLDGTYLNLRAIRPRQ